MNSNSNNSGGLFSSIPIVTKNLLIINFLVWLAQFLLAQKGIDITQYLALHYVQAKDFMPHQIITYMFAHDPNGIGHVFFNMFAVFMFGRLLEMVWGPKRFLIFYMATGIFAGVVHELSWLFDYRDLIFNDEITRVSLGGGSVIAKELFLNQITVVGASGAVFGVLVGFAMLFPNEKLYIIPFPFPIKAKWFIVGYALLELGLGISNRPGDVVAHFAHLGGLVAGVVIVLYWKRKAKSNGGFY